MENRLQLRFHGSQDYRNKTDPLSGVFVLKIKKKKIFSASLVVKHWNALPEKVIKALKPSKPLKPIKIFERVLLI